MFIGNEWINCFFKNIITGGTNYSKVINPECNHFSKIPIRTFNVNINLDTKQTPVLRINIGPENISYSEYVKEGYLTFKNKNSEIQNSIIEAKDVTLTPHTDDVLPIFN